mmetsp:Transcript_19264/g.57232  ORF Transcript_19264/g.57232 Transcript_19264/m.57232 type:complete len:82 (+) Transcript_19264:427-672(+)
MLKQTQQSHAQAKAEKPYPSKDGRAMLQAKAADVPPSGASAATAAVWPLTQNALGRSAWFLAILSLCQDVAHQPASWPPSP